MLDTFRPMILNQFEAALATLNACIDRCPDAAWDERVGNLRFCQVAFHTLFYADYYVGQNEDSFRAQAFHRDNERFFAGYEEFEDRPPQALYDRATVKKYMEHCRAKLKAALAAETDQTLSAPAGFARRTFSRAELYVYTLRHIQHHAAQLSLRLRLDMKADIPWIGSGWRTAQPERPRP
jgi:hypothetical protein